MWARPAADLSDSSQHLTSHDKAPNSDGNAIRNRSPARRKTTTSRQAHTQITAAAAYGCTSSRPVTDKVGPSCSSTASLSPGSPGSSQMFSDLADDYRLVALDLRGHGQSDKPRDGYSDRPLWADDIAAVIRGLAHWSNRYCAAGPMDRSSFWTTCASTARMTSAASCFVDGLTKLGRMRRSRSSLRNC